MQTKLLYIGIMSGTSLDGIDVVLADFTAETPKLVASQHVEFPSALRETLLTFTQAEQANFVDLGEAQTWLGECYADAVLQLLKQANVKVQDIAAIGNHGQTIFHHPHQPHPFTLQIGNQAVLAAKTGIPVVADFRSLDIAYGGQGAPLAPLFHQALFAKPKQTIAVLNIGGIANVSILENQKLAAAFDTGPGNALIDAYVQTYFAADYDDGGKLAQSGTIQTELLQQLLQDAYFKKSPPKSTGKDYFNLDWLEQTLNETLPSYGQTHVDATPSRLDMLATLTELTAASISQALQSYALDDVFICGGGAQNTFLMQRLKQHQPKLQFTSTINAGFEPQWIEALAFAWLAKMRLSNTRFDLRKLTGSTKPVLLGNIILP